MLQTSASTNIKRQRWRRGWLIVIVGLGFVYQACTPGRVDFLTGGSGGEAQLGTGGQDTVGEGTGGNEDLDTSRGSTAGQGGDHDGPPDKPKDPRPYDPNDESIPCFLRGKCLPLCEDHAQLCVPCEHSDGCDWPFPHCDVAQQSCVECLTGDDCRERFGEEFSACSAGKCVQCQHEGDCASGEFCAFGLCGECRKSFDCDFGEICVDLRCEPYEEPRPPQGTGGLSGQGSGGQAGDEDKD